LEVVRSSGLAEEMVQEVGVRMEETGFIEQVVSW
jgi:hypothetical protein